MSGPLPRSVLWRKWLHIACVLPAFLLPYIQKPWAISIAAMAAAGALLFVRRIPGFRALLRSDREFDSGIVLYPLMVLAALLVLPYPGTAAACWSILALGDGAAGLIGRRFPLSPLPWNRSKSWGGSLAFLVAGSAACCILLIWCGVAADRAWRLAACATLAAALVESLPLPLDDNLTVALAAGGVLWILMGNAA